MGACMYVGKTKAKGLMGDQFVRGTLIWRWELPGKSGVQVARIHALLV